MKAKLKKIKSKLKNKGLIFIRKNKNKSKIVKAIYSKMKIKEIVNGKTYYPEMKRKSKKERIKDNKKWYKEHKYVNLCYNVYGLDIENFRNQDEYFERYNNKKERFSRHHKRLYPQKYTIITSNKYLFYSYIENILPESTPKTYFLFGKTKVFAPVNIDLSIMDAIKTLKNGTYICKAQFGEAGSSITKVDVKNKKVLINDGKVSQKDFLKKLKTERYLIQDFIKQHEALAKFNPRTLNTIRIVTTRFNQKAQFFAAIARFGVNNGSVGDNISQGGVAVAVNENGCLDKYGYYYELPRTEEHPDSHVKFENYQLPNWDIVVETVTKLHSFIPGLVAIGWDVAITEDGVKIIEANSNYCSKVMQITNGGLKERWENNKKK